MCLVAFGQASQTHLTPLKSQRCRESVYTVIIMIEGVYEEHAPVQIHREILGY